MKNYINMINVKKKAFVQATYLAEHMTTHSGEKPYTFNLFDKALNGLAI